MLIVWSEEFEAGPDGTPVWDSNTNWEIVTIGEDGNNARFDGYSHDGDQSAKRDGVFSVQTLSTTEPAGAFGADNTVAYSVWAYVEYGQANYGLAAVTLRLRSSATPSERTVQISLYPGGANTGIKFSATDQATQTVGDSPYVGEWVRLQIEWTPTQFIGRVIDNSGVVLDEVPLVNNFLDSGRSVSSVEMEYYHGRVDSVRVEAVTPTLVTTALHGEYVAVFAAEDGATETSMMLTGPDTMVHHGAFKVPPRETERPATVSFQTQLASDLPAWCEIHAQWYRWDSEGEELVPMSRDVISSGKVFGGTPDYTKFSVASDATEGATHWRPVLLFSQTNPSEEVTPLPFGYTVYVEDLFVPDNGKKVDTPYLDGDQPGGRWEGAPRQSTSIYADSVEGTVEVLRPWYVTVTDVPGHPSQLVGGVTALSDDSDATYAEQWEVFNNGPMVISTFDPFAGAFAEVGQLQMRFMLLNAEGSAGTNFWVGIYSEGSEVGRFTQTPDGGLVTMPSTDTIYDLRDGWFYRQTPSAKPLQQAILDGFEIRARRVDSTGLASRALGLRVYEVGLEITGYA